MLVGNAPIACCILNFCEIDLAELLTRLSSRLTALENGTAALESLKIATEEARLTYIQKAKALHEARTKAASKMEQAVTAELKPIKLEKARFLVDIKPLPAEQWSRQGMEQVIDRLEFNFQSQANEQ